MSGGAAQESRSPEPSQLLRAKSPPPRLRLWRFLAFGLLLGLLLVVAKRWFADVYRVMEHSMWPRLLGSDRILVDKTASPRRWEVWIYEIHDHAGRPELRVKRVLALDGEHVDFQGGDVWAGRNREGMERLRRPASILDEMLVPLYGGGDTPPDGRLDVRVGTFSRTAHGALRLGGRGDRTVLSLLGGLIRSEACIYDDHLGPDGSLRPGRNVVPDVRIDVVLDGLEEKATLCVRHKLRPDQRSVCLSGTALRVTSGEGAEEREEISTARPSGLPAGFRLETIDGIFRVAVLDPETGKEVREVFSGERDTVRYGSYSAVMIEVDGGMAELRRLDVRRDVHYFWPSKLGDALKGADCVPAGTAYLVGDNAPVSDDSRVHGPVRFEALGGRAMRVVWPAARWRGLP